MISQACAGLLYKPGRGKTTVVYMAVRILLEKKYIRRVLVISPIRPMYNVWPKQKNHYEEFKHLRVGVMHGEDKEDVLCSDDYDLYCINPHGLPWLFNAKKVNGKLWVDTVRLKWLKERFDMLVVDESTDFRDYSTTRFQLMKHIVPHFKRRYILTGSPTPKSLLDLFGQIYILDTGSSLGRFITHYRASYFTPGGYGGYDWTLQPGARDRIMEKIGHLVQVVDDPIDIPDLLINDMMITLPQAARKLYDSMEDDMLALMGDDGVVAANAAVASGKCRQIANGALYADYEDGDKFKEVHEEKLDALEELLDSLQGAPLLITYEFKFDRDRISKRFKIPCISSGNAREDDRLIDAFSRGELHAVMGHPQSISLGIDGLQKACSDICMMGVTWNLLHYEQVIQRVQRTGSKNKKVTLHRILARDTVDAKVVKVLDRRDRSQQSFMEMLKEMRK